MSQHTWPFQDLSTNGLSHDFALCWIVELSSPVTAFVQDTCRLGENLTVGRRTLFEEWRRWCQECGHEPGSQITFGRNLMAAFAQVGTTRPREGGARVTNYTGIGLGRL